MVVGCTHTFKNDLHTEAIGNAGEYIMVGNKLVKIMQDAGKPSSSESTDLLFLRSNFVSPQK